MPQSLKSVHTFIVAIVGAFGLAVVGLTVGLLERGHNGALAAGHERVSRAVAAAESDVNRSLLGIDMLLAEAGEWAKDWPGPTGVDPAVARQHNKDLQRLLKAALNQSLMLQDVWVLDDRDQILASSRSTSSRLGLTLPEGFLASVLAQPYPTLAVSAPVLNTLTSERVLYFARHIRLGGDRRGVALAAVPLPLLSTLLAPGDMAGRLGVTLEKESGLLLASHPSSEALMGHTLSPALNMGMADGQPRNAKGRLGHGPAIQAVRPTLYAGLFLAADVSVESVLANWKKERQIMLGSAAALLSMLLAAAISAWRYAERMHRARNQVAHANDQLKNANEDLARSLSLVEATLESTADAVLVVGLDRRIQQYNQQMIRMLGLPPEALQAGDLTLAKAHMRKQLVNPQEFFDFAEAAYASPTVETRDQVEFKDGRVFLRHSMPHMLNGQPVGRVWSFQDITAYKQAEQALQQQQDELNRAHNDLAATLAAVPDLLFELDEQGRYWYYHAGHSELQIAPAESFLGHTIHEVLPPAAAEQAARALHEAAEKGSSFGRQIELMLKRGSTWFELSVSRKPVRRGEMQRFLVLARDITERKIHEQLISQQANYDNLTGLPNRRMFREHLAQALRHAEQHRQQVVLMFLDLDRFKEINDTHGHDMGDRLLQTTAQRLRVCVTDADLVARLGGDEFTVVVTGEGCLERALQLSQTLLERLSEPFALGKELDYLSGSIGITVYPDDGTDSETLIKQADQAMYAAKRQGRNRVERFSPAMQEAALIRARVARDLRSAVSEQQLWLAYQPIVDLRTGRIHKAEALVRWQHPIQGLVSPATFIPIAEESGSIHDIGNWVFQTAAMQVLQWRRTLHPDFQISVNKSPAQFRENAARCIPWAEFLQSLDLPGSAITMEITEGLLMDASPATREHLLGVHRSGIQIALDDFGTGYSALSYLHQFELDYLKIDQSFVRHLQPGSKELALCKATIVMAHELGLKVVAEGIETAEQRDLLTSAGCDYGQGYLFSRPVPATEFETLLATHPQPWLSLG